MTSTSSNHADTNRDEIEIVFELKYDAFISYSHKHNGKLAKQLEKDLTRYNRKFWKLRSHHIFRDTSELEADLVFWKQLQKKLNQSRYLIIIASPESAKAKWVNEEIRHWLSTKQNPLDNIIIALNNGTIEKHPDTSHYLHPADNALPEALQQYINKTEPTIDLFYVDYRPKENIQLTRTQHKETTAKIVATLQNKPLSQILRTHHKQRNRRVTARTAIAIAATLLALASTLLFLRANNEAERANTAQNKALEEADRARAAANQESAVRLAVQAENMRESNPALAVALAAESTQTTSEPTEESLNALMLTRSHFSQQHTHQIGEPLTDHTDTVTDVALNHDGTLLATASFDQTVRLWDPSTGQQLGDPLLGHAERVYGVAFNHDGTLLATVSKDQTVRLWDPATGQQLGDPLVGHADTVWGVVFNHNGTLLGRCGCFDSVGDVGGGDVVGFR